MLRRPSGRVALAVLGLAMALGPAGLVAAEPLELKVKAAFLYNFARLVSWPSGKFTEPGQPLETCIFDQDPVGQALEEAFAGKSIDGRPLAVRRFAHATGWQSCHIAYVGGSFPDLARNVMRDLTSHGVLTVHEGPAPLPDGVIRLYLEERKLRFEVNQAAVDRGRLRLSSRLMALAVVVNVKAGDE